MIRVLIFSFDAKSYACSWFQFRYAGLQLRLRRGRGIVAMREVDTEAERWRDLARKRREDEWRRSELKD